MALSAAASQLSACKVIALNYHSWPQTGNHLQLKTPVFIISCEGCVGSFHISTDLTLPWKCYFSFMWCTKSFNWEFTNILIIIARGFQLLPSEQLPLYGQAPQGSALRVPERVLGLSPLAQGHAVKPHILGKSMRLLPAAGMIWQQKPSYTHRRDSSTSPVNTGHSQCHCSSAASVTQTWGMEPERSISCLHACVGWMHWGGQYCSPGVSSTKMKIHVWFMKCWYCTTLYQLLNRKQHGPAGSGPLVWIFLVCLIASLGNTCTNTHMNTHHYM